MVENVKFQERVLEISGNQSTVIKHLEHEISKVLYEGDQVFILFKMTGKTTPSQNIICLNEAGNLIWRVQDPGMYKIGKCRTPRDLFGSIWFDSNKKLHGHARDTDYCIDMETGKILSDKWTK